MSHFSNYWGMAADNVVNYEVRYLLTSLSWCKFVPWACLIEKQVVLADSTIIQASASSHADLFKALKGGGPNFGMHPCHSHGRTVLTPP